MAENNKVYPDGTSKETEEFKERRDVNDIANELIKKVAIETTEKAFKSVGKEKASKSDQDTNFNNGEYATEKRYGNGTENNEFNVTISFPKGAKAPSNFQKVTTWSGKQLISTIKVQITGSDIAIEYENTEAASFIDGKGLNGEKTFKEITNKSKFEKELKEYFQKIADAEVSYLLGTKIGNDDKIEKNMDDSIVKENRTTKLSLKDLISGSFDDVDKKVDILVKESTKKEKKEDKEEKDDKLLLGDEEKANEKKTKTIEERDAELKEMTTAGPAGTGAGRFDTTLTGKSEVVDKKQGKEAIGQPGEVVADQDNVLRRSFQSSALGINEAVQKTSYGKAQKPKPYIRKTIAEESYPNKVELIPGSGYVPVGMDKNTMVGGDPKVDINSQEELDIATYGTHGKTGKKPAARPNLEEGIVADLTKRKFVLNEENEKAGVNKRYIITEKISQEDQNSRWKTLCQFEKNETIEESAVVAIEIEKEGNNGKMVSREQGEEMNLKEFEKNNMDSSPACGCEDGDEDTFELVDKIAPKGQIKSLAQYKIEKSDLQENRAYVIDHFTKKLIQNPKFDPSK